MCMGLANCDNHSFSELAFLVCLTSSIFFVSELKKFGERRVMARRKRLDRSMSAKSLISLV